MPARSSTWLRPTRSALCITLAVLLAAPAIAQAAPPANDDFADAQVVRVGDRVTGSTAEATLEAGEPAPSSALLTRSIWYRLTTTATEAVRVDSCSSPKFAEVAIYTGAGVGTLTEVARTTGGCRLYLTPTAGTAYYVRLAAYEEHNGDVVLNVARPKAPANDDFENAQPLGRPAHVGGSLVDATVQPGEPGPGMLESTRSVWYRLTATSADIVTVGTCNSGNSAPIAVYTGASIAGLTEVGSEIGACGYRSITSFITTVGTTYYIVVTGPDDFILDISGQEPPPTTANFPLPPARTCPFAFAGDGVTYSGTHSGGGAVCLTLTKDFSGVAWFHALDVPGDTCRIGWKVERMELPTPVVDRRFSHGSSYARIIGSFDGGRGASGTLQMTQLTGPLSFCNSPVLTWKATTRATPPWLDETAPVLRLRAGAVQRPLRRGAIAVLVRCPVEACTARATATVAGIRVTTGRLKIATGSRGRTLTLRLATRATRAVAAALRSRASIRARVTVVATDAAANRSSARRTITLRP